MKIRSLISGGVFLLSLCLVISNCGSDGAATDFKIIPLKKAGARTNQSARDVFTDLPASSTNYGYSQVDGIKITVNKVRGGDAASDNPLTTVDLNKALQLDGGTVSLGGVNFNKGKYRQVELIIKNTWQVKAYCKVNQVGANYDLVYSTAAGFKKVACTGGCSAPPSDYEYTPERVMIHNTDFADLAAAKAAEQYLQTNYLFEITDTSKPSLSVLYDSTYNITCWDGLNWVDNQTFGGFVGISGTQRELFYPNNEPVMAGSYLPAFAYLSTDGSETSLYARTFAATSDTVGNVPTVTPTDVGFNWAKVQIATLMYKGTGAATDEIFQGSTRNFGGTNGQNIISMGLEGFTAAAGGTGFDFFSSNWYWSGKNEDPPRFLRNYKVEGFNPPATPAPFSTTAGPGPDCDKTFPDFKGANQSQACDQGGLGTARTIRWHELVRNVPTP